MACAIPSQREGVGRRLYDLFNENPSLPLHKTPHPSPRREFIKKRKALAMHSKGFLN
jgi:hypothetical protein